MRKRQTLAVASTASAQGDVQTRMREWATALGVAIAMSVYAASLGVDCSHCHETDRSLNIRTPKSMVATMLPIFDVPPGKGATRASPLEASRHRERDRSPGGAREGSFGPAEGGPS